MKRQYLFTFLFLALALGTLSVVSAHGGDLNDDHDVPTLEPRELRFEARREEMRAKFEAKRAAFEAQREEIRAKAEARRDDARARGDEFRAKREAARVGFEAKRAEMDARREARRVEFETKREEKLLKKVEFQQTKTERKVEHTARVMTATIERLEKIIKRIESRITKIQVKGGTTTESEGFVVKAKDNLTDAQVAVDAFATIDLSGDNVQENYKSIRTVAAAARELIRAAHENLMLAVRSLSSAGINVEDDNSDDN